MINAKQCRASRAWLSWSQDELAKRSLVSKRAIAGFELEKTVPHDRTLRDLQRAFEDAGIIFLMDGKRGIGLQEVQEGVVQDVKPLPGT
ncbi:helix-turn-helix transcriptional regulator [Labrenzia sp. PHM005]|uniref:helix-turn-helix domain-containing protein n=1 Tax=Labrenzia sp. PHM005 TaxID=2590016 RepID=UPI00114059BE|nr:helix-turn-helix transcriptional regulator [Labrenzia sp. PHM005]QDG77709.1 helix-turn-helix transcriptional regulator [Labrenzia sp. PHM005]